MTIEAPAGTPQIVVDFVLAVAAQADAHARVGRTLDATGYAHEDLGATWSVPALGDYAMRDSDVVRRLATHGVAGLHL